MATITSCQLPGIDATHENNNICTISSMTSYAGYTISAAECCGVRYAIRRYRSINFSLSCYWIDGYRENSLMPNDHRLRQCKCITLTINAGKYLVFRKNTLASICHQALPFPHQPADRVPHGDVLGGLLIGRVAKSCRCLGV